MPETADDLFNRAMAADSAGQIDVARNLLEQVLKIAPHHVAALVNLAILYQDGGAFERAEPLYRRALALSPDTAVIHHNLANLLLKRGDVTGAIAACKTAVRLDPDTALFRLNLAGAYELVRDLDSAVAQLDAIVAKDANDIPARMAKIPILFEQGRFPEAWEHYAFRHRLFWNQYPEHRRPLPSPLWRGEPLAGKKLLIAYDQGLGEQIMFASLFPRLIEQGARLVIECETRLVPLFARSFPAAQVVPWQQPWNAAVVAPDIDFHIAAGDLGRWLQSNCDQPPSAYGHLIADPDNVRMLRARYEAVAQGRKIVGVSWNSKAVNFAHFKSLPLSALKALTDDPSLFCVSVQYGPEGKAATSLYVDPDVDATRDIDLAAAQIAAMDAVVAISNTAAHLAGALGKPTYLLLPKVKGRIWYWFPERAQNPWYASVHSFVQSVEEDWSAPVAAVVAAIRRA